MTDISNVEHAARQPEPYLTVSEVAQMLGLCERSVYDMLRAGRMAGKRFGRTWRVKREWAEAAGRANAA